MENDMERWLKERERLSHRLEKLTQKKRRLLLGKREREREVLTQAGQAHTQETERMLLASVVGPNTLSLDPDPNPFHTDTNSINFEKNENNF